jgi:hypothetical protein
VYNSLASFDLPAFVKREKIVLNNNNRRTAKGITYNPFSYNPTLNQHHPSLLYRCPHPCPSRFSHEKDLLLHINAGHTTAGLCHFNVKNLKSIKLDGCDTCHVAFMPREVRTHRCPDIPYRERDDSETLTINAALAQAITNRDLTKISLHNLGFLNDISWAQVFGRNVPTYPDMPKNAAVRENVRFICLDAIEAGFQIQFVICFM